MSCREANAAAKIGPWTESRWSIRSRWIGLSGSRWSSASPRLPRCSVYDCRGHGESDTPAGPYTVELFARDLADLLDHVGWDSALIAGASMGGCVALAFAAAYPARTAALGLIDTTAWYGADAPQQWAERSSRAVNQGMSALVEFQSTRWFGDTFRAQRPDVVERCVDVFVRNDVHAYVETCKMLGSPPTCARRCRP